jgi:hypothetical protein
MEIEMTLWKNVSLGDQGQVQAVATMAAPKPSQTQGGILGSDAPVRSSKQLQDAVLSNLKSKRGILDGRDLYRVYKESDQPALKIAIRELEKNNLVSVKGDLEAPLGVFQSVLVER